MSTVELLICYFCSRLLLVSVPWSSLSLSPPWIEDSISAAAMFERWYLKT